MYSSSCPLLGGCASTECAGKRSYFKFTSFRPGQLETLLPLLHGKDAFARMATGARKSLCLFLAPLAIGERALGIIISPLNALMDQPVHIHCNKLLKTVVNMIQIDANSMPAGQQCRVVGLAVGPTHTRHTATTLFVSLCRLQLCRLQLCRLQLRRPFGLLYPPARPWCTPPPPPSCAVRYRKF